MARTQVNDISELAYGDSVEISTVFDDDSVHTFYGQIADIEPQQEIVNVVDANNGEIRQLIWGASDEEERTWYKRTEDDIPPTVEELIGRAALEHNEKRDAEIAAYEVRKRRSEARHQRKLESISAEYRNKVANLEFEQNSDDTDLEEDEED